MSTTNKRTRQPAAPAVAIYDDAETVQHNVGRGPVGPVRDQDDPAHEKEREDAFETQRTWHGQPVSGLAMSTKAAWLNHRVRMGWPALEKVLADVDGFLADALAIIYLSTVEPSEWHDCRSDAQALQDRIDKWADANVEPSEAVAAVLLGFQLYRDSNVNRHEPAPPARPPHGDDMGN